MEPQVLEGDVSETLFVEQFLIEIPQDALCLDKKSTKTGHGNPDWDFD